MLLSSVSESTCFFLGALSDMPAVRAFALYAGMALLIDFLMQMTVFVALLALDMARQESRRYDILCCVRASKKAAAPSASSSASCSSGDGGGGDSGGATTEGAEVGTLYRVFKVLYAPFLMKRWVRPAVVVLFFGWFCASLAVAPHIEVGLDQEISMPDDSFVLKYFEYLKHFLSVGPPFYVVLNTESLRFDLTDPMLQNKVCGSSGCDPDSLQAQVKLWSRQSNVTYVASPAQSWIDDYFDWIANPACCSYDPDTLEVCQSNVIVAERKENEVKAPRKGSNVKKEKEPVKAKKEEKDSFFDSDFFDEDEDDDFFGDAFDESEGEEEQPEDDESLLKKHWKNYDDFYYYADDDDDVAKRTAAQRYKREANDRSGCRRCATVALGGAPKKRPEPRHFRQHLRWFVEDNPGVTCPSAGKGAYRWDPSRFSIETLGCSLYTFYVYLLGVLLCV